MWPNLPPYSMAQFSGVVNVQYPPVYEKFLATLSVVDLNLGSYPVTFVRRGDKLLRPTTFDDDPSGGGSWCTGDNLSRSMVRNGQSIHAKRVARKKHLSVGLFLLFIVYSSVSHTIFQTFACDL